MLFNCCISIFLDVCKHAVLCLLVWVVLFPLMIARELRLLFFREREPKSEDTEPRREPTRANDVSSLKSKPVRALLSIHFLIHLCTQGVSLAALGMIINGNMHFYSSTNFLHVQICYRASWYGVRCGWIHPPLIVLSDLKVVLASVQ